VLGLLGDEGKVLYRGMRKAADGFPVEEASGTALGVRPGEIPTHVGMVLPGEGGMSVAPDDPMGLPEWRRPPSLGGTATHPAWELREADLPTDLQFRPDPANPVKHGFVEPRRMMPIGEYEALLGETRMDWKEHT
jgi:hypothetical protein